MPYRRFLFPLILGKATNALARRHRCVGSAGFCPRPFETTKLQTQRKGNGSFIRESKTRRLSYERQRKKARRQASNADLRGDPGSSSGSSGHASLLCLRLWSIHLEHAI